MDQTRVVVLLGALAAGILVGPFSLGWVWSGTAGLLGAAAAGGCLWLFRRPGHLAWRLPASLAVAALALTVIWLGAAWVSIQQELVRQIGR